VRQAKSAVSRAADHGVDVDEVRHPASAGGACKALPRTWDERVPWLANLTCRERADA
jgi:hypothetical protein